MQAVCCIVQSDAGSEPGGGKPEVTVIDHPLLSCAACCCCGGHEMVMCGLRAVLYRVMLDQSQMLASQRCEPPLIQPFVSCCLLLLWGP